VLSMQQYASCLTVLQLELKSHFAPHLPPTLPTSRALC
jgi:hypothetical protein